MKVAIHGLVTQAHLDDAELFAGIVPTEFLSTGSGRKHASVSAALPVHLMPPDPMVPDEPGVIQAQARMMVTADALICIGRNDHLLKWAASCKVPVYEVAR